MITRRTLLALLTAAPPARIAVIAHRGEHFRNPENSLAGIEAATKMGVDYVEIDVRTTRDGSVVLMHDPSVDRMTDGHGVVAELSGRDIGALELKGGGKVPSLDEALETLRAGGAGVYLDSKQISATDIMRSLSSHRMLERAVIYGSLTLLRQLAALGPLPRVMPEAHSLETLRSLLTELKARVVAFDHRDWKDEIIDVARKAGVDIYVDRLGAGDHRLQWEEAIRKGATGIQTDHPAELIAFLSNR